MSTGAAAPHGGEPGAHALDRARRTASVRTIAAVFAVLSFVVAPSGIGFGLPSFLALELVSAVGYGAVWWTARTSHHPERGGLAIVGILLAQMVFYSSALATSTVDEVHIAYFACLAPFIAAVTMSPRGVTLTGAVLAAWLAVQVALQMGAPSFDAFVPSLPPVTFFLLIWAVALGASLSSRRALDAHARDEERARAARDAAQQAEERYRIVSDRMSDLVSVFDPEGNYVYASPSHERVLGVAPAELLGRPAPELVHPDDLDACAEAFERARREGSSFFVTRLRVPGGAFRWFHIGLSSVDVGQGHDGTVAASGRDITEQRALAAELEATRRMEALGRLAGGVAHDFNNLLLVIESCSDLAAARLPADHPAHKELDDVRGAAERAAAITRQLLTFARRQVLPKAEASAVGEVFRDLEPILARIAGPGVALNVDVTGAETIVDASAVQLEQLLMNLVVNARDAMPEGGTLSIEARDRTIAEHEIAGLRAGRYAEIDVKDTGVGMSDEVQAHIFEPFFTTKAAGQGTGLGLATVFGLVSQLGGRVGVRSAEGAGSAFSVLLPASDELRAREGVAEAEAGPAAAAALRILVVDDEAAVRTLIGRMLREAGHRPTEAGSIDEAIGETEAPDARFDVIVTDVVLGSGDAIAMLDRLEAAQPGAAVVVISGFSPSPERFAKLGERGAEFLPKPFGASELLEALARARSRSRSVGASSG